MPHTFDTGATKAQRTLVREAVIARLSGLLKSAIPARYLTAIKSLPRPYGGDSGDIEGLDMLYRSFNGQAPAIGVALGRQVDAPGGFEATDGQDELEVSVYVASQHSRDLVEGRLAADSIATLTLTADPGIETMLEHVDERLRGQRIGVASASELRGVETDIVATFADVTIAERKFTVQLDRQIKPWRDTTQLVTSIENRLESDSIPDGTVGYDPFVTTVSTLDPED